MENSVVQEAVEVVENTLTLPEMAQQMAKASKKARRKEREHEQREQLREQGVEEDRTGIVLSYKTLVEKYTAVFDKVIDKFCEEDKVIFHYQKYYKWIDSQGIYLEIDTSEMKRLYLLPILKKDGVGMSPGEANAVLTDVSTSIPLTREAYEEVKRKALAADFNIDTGKRIDFMPAGKDQCVRIVDDKVVVTRTRDHKTFIKKTAPEVQDDEVIDEPADWVAFRNVSFPGDEDTPRAVAQVLGAVAYTPDVPNTIPMFVGREKSGKGVLSRLCAILAGGSLGAHTENVADRTSGRFQASAYYDKRVLIMNDVDDFNNNRFNVIMKTVTGGDAVTLERKGVDAVSINVELVPVIASNNLDLKVVHESYDKGAMERRILPFQFKHRVKDNEEVKNLEETLSQPHMVRYYLQEYAKARFANKNTAGHEMFLQSENTKEMIERLIPEEIVSVEDIIKRHFILTEDENDVVDASTVSGALRGDLEFNKYKLDDAARWLSNHMGMKGRRVKRTTINGEKKVWYKKIKLAPTGVDALDVDTEDV